jgi:hypothetical protein
MLASQSNAGNGIKGTSFSVIYALRRSARAFPYRQREREAAGGVVTVVPLIGLEAPSRVASVAGFFSARCIMSVQSRHWLDYDPVALVVLLVGMSAVAFLVLSI